MVITVDRLLLPPVKLSELDIFTASDIHDFDRAVAQGRNSYLRVDAPGMWSTGDDPFLFNTDIYQADAQMRWIYSQTFKRPEIGIFAFQNMKVVTGVWQVLTDDGRLLEPSIPNWHKGDIGAFVRGARFAKSIQSDLGRLDEPVLQCLGSAYSNYGHWHHDYLPSFVIAKAALKRRYKSLLGSAMPGFNTTSLQALQMDHQQFLSMRDGVIAAPVLYVPSRAFGVIDPCRFCCRMYDQIRTSLYDVNLSSNPASRFNRRIYVARFDAASRRGMVNEQELAAALEKEGFEILTPGSLTYSEQVTNFSEAVTLIGQHGAGLMNAGFLLPRSVLVEIHPVPWGVSTFPRLVHSRGCSFRCYFVAAQSEADLSMKIKINIDDFLRYLNKMKLT